MVSSKRFNSLVKTISDIKSPALLKQFLTDLLTPSERSEIGLRWQLVQYLYEGMPQRTIAKKLKISLCKITRGSRELKRRNSGFKQVLEKDKIKKK